MLKIGPTEWLLRWRFVEDGRGEKKPLFPHNATLTWGIETVNVPMSLPLRLVWMRQHRGRPFMVLFGFIRQVSYTWVQISGTFWRGKIINEQSIIHLKSMISFHYISCMRMWTIKFLNDLQCTSIVSSLNANCDGGSGRSLVRLG